MGYGRSSTGEPRKFIGVEMHAVRQPGPLIEPAAFLQIFERSALMDLQAIAVLVLSFGEVRVRADVELLGQHGGRAHQRGCDRKRRAGRKRDLNHGAVAGLMIARHHAFRVGEDRVFVLHDAVRRQSAVTLGKIHRAAGQQHAQTEPLPNGHSQRW